MSLFYDATGNLKVQDNLEARLRIEAQLRKLWERVVMLRQAGIEGRLDPDALLRIAELSTVQLDRILASQHDTELNQFYEIIAAPFPSEAPIIPSDNLLKCLQWFDREHGQYLDLFPLAAWEPSDIKHHLNHLATFYNVFIQGVILPPRSDEIISPDIDVTFVQKECRKWQTTRASQTFYNPYHRNLRLVEKFITNRLSLNEWLTEPDIFDAFRLLGLDNFGAHATNFDMRDIGAMLHFERQKHEHDSPAIPYTIPLVLNNSHSLDEQGTHWTRLLITVDPRKNPPQIAAQYTDSLGSINRNDIETTIHAALKYKQTDTTRAIDHPITAYPHCRKPRIQMRGTGEQYDGYSCGYRALQGLLHDLVKTGFLPNPTPRQREFLACKTSSELRDFVYKTLISEQAINPEEVDSNLIEERANGRHYVKPECIENQLREWNTMYETHDARSVTASSAHVDSAEIQNQTLDNDQAIHDYLQKITDQFNTKAYRNLLQGKFDLQPATDNSQYLAYKLMAALLYLRYRAYRTGNLLAHAQLKAASHDLLKNIRQSNNPYLIAAITIAQKRHFSALTNHWTDHEFEKGYYLKKLMAEWRVSSHGEARLQWKKPEFFTTWWHSNDPDTSDTEQTKASLSQAIHWLINYKDKWWKRSWVSSDRKAVATALINQLKQLDETNSSPAEILQLISKARQTLLEDGTRHKRKISAGLNGRLYLFLNDLETRVCAASSPTEMDNSIQHEFNEIKTVLTAFKNRNIYPNSLTPILEKLKLEVLTPDNPHNVADQYRLVSEFFTRVLTNPRPEKLEEDDDNLTALLTYCRQKQMHLVHYFGQCSQLSAINQQRSVQVFRAMSVAASTVVKQWLVDEPKKKAPTTEIKYQGKVIPLNNTVNLHCLPPAFIKSSSSFLFFNKKLSLNTQKINALCTDLVATIAQEIVARSPKKEVNIEFTSLNLKPYHSEESHDNKPHLLELTVALRIDGVDTAVTYTIKSQTGELARIKPELEKLDDPQMDCAPTTI